MQFNILEHQSYATLYHNYWHSISWSASESIDICVLPLCEHLCSGGEGVRDGKRWGDTVVWNVNP